MSPADTPSWRSDRHRPPFQDRPGRDKRVVEGLTAACGQLFVVLAVREQRGNLVAGRAFFLGHV